MTELIENIFKETQTDGKRKWSWFRIAGFIWFWIADIGSLLMYWLKGLIISPEIATLTGIILLGVVSGKAVTAFQTAVTQINVGKGG